MTRTRLFAAIITLIALAAASWTLDDAIHMRGPLSESHQ